jgi:HD-GYP domain-containing protein (c-di-GMP phosphodiesterase class II)/DNA-binding CsgD family transcriptional regulator
VDVVPAPAGGVRRAELLAALSLAIDLGLGQPLEHMLRSCVIGMQIADLVGADATERETAYYGGLLSWIGCHADSQELAEMFGDDIEFRAATYAVDWRGAPFASLLVRHAGSGRQLPAHTARLGSFMLHARSQLTQLISSHCRSAGSLAARLGLPDDVSRGLTYTFERWDGGGLPTGVAGVEIPLGMRIVHLSDVVEVHLRTGGVEGAIAVARQRSGTQFDPALVAVFCEHATQFLPTVAEDVWRQAIQLAPDSDRVLADAELDTLLQAMGDFVDLKSPWTIGHSRAVSELAGRAGEILGLEVMGVRALRQAGHVQDLGRMGVPNRVLSKAGPLSETEQERVRLHPYLTERILARVAALRGIAPLAAAHHERLDGSGYPRGASGAELGLPERILAAAEGYQTLCEPYPGQPAIGHQGVAEVMRRSVRDGALDGPAAEAILAAAGYSTPARGSWPSGLTDREVDVLRLIARGSSAADVATRLSISQKTARNHVEHIYVKLGISNRTGAAMFALSHGLLGGTPAG